MSVKTISRVPGFSPFIRDGDRSEFRLAIQIHSGKSTSFNHPLCEQERGMIFSQTQSDRERTLLLQQHINELSRQGGGTVQIPAGTWSCGSIRLRSGVELHLQSGAVLQASGDSSLYDPVGDHDPSITANAKLRAFFWASGEEDISIRGPGRIDGGGTREQCPDWASAQDLFRPALFYLQDCTRLRFTECELVNSKWWCLHLRRCTDVCIRGVLMDHSWPNSDGIDPDGCRNVLISDCRLRCGDDCIVFKSTQGDHVENATVTNCILETNHACFKLGTESFGAFRNITVSNCVMRGHVAFGLYMKDGGIMENIRGTNLVVDTTSPWPVLIDAMARYYDEGKPAGVIRNVALSNCSFSGPGRVWLEGPEESPLENIRLQEIDWHVSGPVPSPPETKPTGSARTRINPARPSYESHPEHILAIHCGEIEVNGVRLSGPDGQRPLLNSF